MLTWLRSSHARGKPAATKPFDRPRDSEMIQKQSTSEKKQNKRGRISNEARLRRIENRKQKRIESRRSYRTLKETIPKEEWRLAHSTRQEDRASKAGGTNKDKTWGSICWKKKWYSQNEPVKYDGETRVNAPKWEYVCERTQSSITKR